MTSYRVKGSSGTIRQSGGEGPWVFWTWENVAEIDGVAGDTWLVWGLPTGEGPEFVTTGPIDVTYNTNNLYTAGPALVVFNDTGTATFALNDGFESDLTFHRVNQITVLP